MIKAQTQLKGGNKKIRVEITKIVTPSPKKKRSMKLRLGFFEKINKSDKPIQPGSLKKRQRGST